MQALMQPPGCMVLPRLNGFFYGSTTLVSGTGTYVAPALCQLLFVWCIGQGNASGGTGNASAGQLLTGSGSGSGGFSASILSPAMARQGFICTISGTTQVQLQNGVIVCAANRGNGGNSLTTGTTEVFALGGAPAATTGLVAGDYTFAGNPGQRGHRVSGTIGKGGDGAPGPWGGAIVGKGAQGSGVTGGQYGGGGSAGLSINAGGSITTGASGAGLIAFHEYY